MLKKMNEYSPVEQFQMIFNGTSSIVNEAYLEQQLYILYKASVANSLCEEKELDMKALELLENLGYNLDNIGTYLYKAVIVKAAIRIALFSKENKIEAIDNLKQELNNAYSQFYFDLARNERDIGTRTFHEYINGARNNIDNNKIDPILNFEIYGSYQSNRTIGEDVLVLGIYFAENEYLKETNNKVKQLETRHRMRGNN